MSNEIIRAIGHKKGVIGLVLSNEFLEKDWINDKTIPVNLATHVKRHAEYIASLVSWNHIGIGSDLDGGFGREESPLEIDTVADLHKIGNIVPAETREAVLSSNWLNFLRRSLPRET